MGPPNVGATWEESAFQGISAGIGNAKIGKGILTTVRRQALLLAFQSLNLYSLLAVTMNCSFEEVPEGYQAHVVGVALCSICVITDKHNEGSHGSQ